MSGGHQGHLVHVGRHYHVPLHVAKHHDARVLPRRIHHRRLLHREPCLPRDLQKAARRALRDVKHVLPYHKLDLPGGPDPQ